MLIYSSRSSQQQQTNLWTEQFSFERQKLRLQIAKQIRNQMSSIVGHLPTADLLLITSDSQKLPAHLCILKTRAPSFYKRYVQPICNNGQTATLQQPQLLEIPVNIEFSALEFFIRSIYTDEEVLEMEISTNLNKLNGSSVDDNNDDTEGNFESQSSGTDQKKDFSSKINLSENQQMSASYPSPNSPREMLMPGTTNNSSLANNERRQTSDDNQVRKHSAIFPYFIKMGIEEEEEGCSTSRTYCGSTGVMSRSLPLSTGSNRGESPHPRDIFDCNTIRGRAIAARRRQKIAPAPVFDDQNAAASKLAGDLLKMLVEERDSADVLLLAANGEQENAHSCILWACGSEFFREQISSQSTRLYNIDLPRFSRTSVAFLLQFIYGGLTCLPATIGNDNDAELLDPWELVELGAFTKVESFVKVVALHLRAVHCHFFHRPCASCVSAVFEALPKIEREIPELKQLFNDAMQWQAAHFTRIWRGRIFLHLSFQWQKHCRDVLLQSIDEENVVDVLLGCEKLNLALPRVKQQISAQQVLRLVNDVEEYCMEFLTSSLDSLIQSKAFCSYGKGLALNLALLEDILPTLIHSLCPETTIRTFVALKDSKNVMQKRSFDSSSNSMINTTREQHNLLGEEWNPRFKNLCLRLIDLLERHMFHYACSIVNSTEWPLLSVEDQNRVNEFGLFIEMRMPRIAPPRLSSASSHNYCKRSSSVGIYSSHPERELIRNETIVVPERARSMERIRGGVDGRAGSSRRTSRQISGGSYSRPSSLAIQVEEDNLYENDQTSVATTTTVQLENELTTQSGTKNDQKLEKETVPKIPQKDTEKNSPNNKNSKDPKQFEEEKELENIQSTSTTTIDCSDQSLQNLESQKSLKEKEVSHTEDKNDENFEEKVEENLIINEQMDAKESSKEEEQSVPSITLRNRQRTHTILNVDRKSIAAAAHQHSNVLIANNASNTEIKRNAAKPHSIVRPMPKVINGQSTISTSEATTPEASSTPSSVPLERRERRNVKQPTNIASTSINKSGKIETKVQKRQTGGVTQGVSQQQQQRVVQQKSGIKKPTTVTRK
uniref:BTB domain-containing protein n=1 Tax=Meloidogyne javanica TaxID=6303 RepID=A0A915LL54_MELJA